MSIKVYNKKTDEQVYVYGVQNDKHGYPMFLVRLGSEWKWRSAKNYTDNPYENCEHEWKETGYASKIFMKLKYECRCKKCGLTSWK